MVFCYFDYLQRPNGIDSIKSQTNGSGNIYYGIYFLDVNHHSLMCLNGGHGDNCGFDVLLLTCILAILN